MEAYAFLKAFDNLCKSQTNCNTCPLNNFWGCGSIATDISGEGYEEEFKKAAKIIEKWKDENMKNNDLECVCQREEWEEGETFYFSSSWDGGIEYNYINNVKFCPVCGRKLPEREL